MEEWQRKHITETLPELISLTEFNVIVKAGLVAKNILAKADIDKLDAVHTQHGKSDSTYHYYQFLMGRTNAYKILTKVLLENRQTGAARMLIAGVPSDVSEKPLTYLDIPIKWDGFKDMEIEVNGKRLKLQEFIPTVNYEKLKQIFEETAGELELYDTFVTKERSFVLAKNTVPSKPPIYLSRFLSNRIKIDMSIFEANCPDIFVFKNSIARYKLSQIAKPHLTDTSNSQLNKITCRFIHLDENEDWTDLRKSAKAPIHLINYEADQHHFLLEDSSAPSDLLKKLGSQNERVYMTEEDFVQQQLSQDCTSSSVCICDSPGMGKTLLLANIARKMADKCAGRIIVFIQLTSFAQDCFPKSPNTIFQPETSLITVLSHIGSSQQNPQLLIALVKARQLSLEIFFDGFDELPADKVEWTRQIFRYIITFQNVRIYITSRPHMRRGLETSLGVVAYDILPFNQQNQVDFLVQFWINRKPDADQLSLQSYATDCLEAVNKSLTENDREIAGIPLLCQLIAEVYGNKKSFRSIKTGSFRDVPLQISGMYREFIENKICMVTSNKTEFDNMKLVHIWHALKLLFSTNNFHKSKLFRKVKHLLISSKIVKAGILQKHSNGPLEFIHRTFAEYPVAEYFSTKLQNKENQKTEEMKSDATSILKLLMDIQISQQIYDVIIVYYFPHPVVVSFFDSTLRKIKVSEELNIALAAAISSFSSKDFISVLDACCQHNLLDMFSFLGESSTKCDNSWVLKCFTHETCYQILRVCILKSTSQMFHSVIQLLTKVLKFDMALINTFDEDDTLLQIAVQEANYAAVEYFVDRVPLKNQSLLGKCVGDINDIVKRENILLLLLNKDPTLIHESPYILVDDVFDVKLFKILVNFGADLTAIDEYGNNCAMHHAAYYMSPSDYHDIVQFLLTDRKAQYLFLENEKWKDPMPNIIKHFSLLPETLELLLSIPGMDINMTDRREQPLLFSAIEGNKMTNLEQLVARGVDYNARNRRNESLLHLAAKHRGVEIVRYLLSLKLDPNSRDDDGWTPLHYAAWNPTFSVVEVLVENGANVQAKNKDGQTALHFSVQPNCSNRIEIIRYLIGKGAVVNECDNEGNTPLHFCPLNKEVADCLIGMGADIHAKNKFGKTVLHEVVGRYAVGVSVSGYEEVIKHLVGKGLGVNDRDNDGNTPLHLCNWVWKGSNCLIELGADIHAKNKYGKTPAQKKVWFC